MPPYNISHTRGHFPFLIPIHTLIPTPVAVSHFSFPSTPLSFPIPTHMCVALTFISRLFPIPKLHACDQILTKKLAVWGQSSCATKTTQVVSALELINRCVHSLVPDVVLSLACIYELHTSWEAHLLVVAQTKAHYRSNRCGQRLSSPTPARRLSHRHSTTSSLPHSPPLNHPRARVAVARTGSSSRPLLSSVRGGSVPPSLVCGGGAPSLSTT
jgi:hypothetical protein